MIQYASIASQIIVTIVMIVMKPTTMMIRVSASKVLVVAHAVAVP